MAELDLLVDTSIRQAGLVAVSDRGRVVAEEAVLGGVDTLQVALARALVQGGRRIARVVVARGPGSYIGVRSGLAAALGVAQSRGLSLQLVGSLEAEAARYDLSPSDLLVLRSAGRGGLLGQRFCSTGQRWRPVESSWLLPPREPWLRLWPDGVSIADDGLLAPPELGASRASPRRGRAAGLAWAATWAAEAGVPYDLLSAEYAVRVGAQR